MYLVPVSSTPFSSSFTSMFLKTLNILIPLFLHIFYQYPRIFLFIFFTILEVIALSKIWSVKGYLPENQNKLRSFKGTGNVRSVNAIQVQNVLLTKSLCTFQMLTFGLLLAFLNFQEDVHQTKPQSPLKI